MKDKYSDSLQSKFSRMKKILDILSMIYPNITIQLNHSNALELLIATILSAQCTDARVNIVTQSLFRKYKSAKDYTKVPLEELEKDIFSTGFYKSKAKNIKKCCEKIIDKYNGEVPSSMEELLELGGVGRKTANVVLSHWFGIPGIVVDTHVKRISNLLEMVNTSNPVIIEKELEKLIPKDLWVIFTHYFINLGRNTCIARRPKCKLCPIKQYCPSAEV